MYSSIVCIKYVKYILKTNIIKYAFIEGKELNMQNI